MLTAALLCPGPCSAAPELCCGPWGGGGGWGYSLWLSRGQNNFQTGSQLKKKPSSVAMNSRILLLLSPWQLQLPWVSLYPLRARCLEDSYHRGMNPGQGPFPLPSLPASIIGTPLPCPPSCFLQRWPPRSESGVTQNVPSLSSARLRPPPQPPAAAACDTFPGKTGS